MRNEHEHRLQTVVSWYRSKLNSCSTASDERFAYEKAKQLEKENMIEFAKKVLDNSDCSFTGMVVANKPIEEIYNETYGTPQ